MKKFGEIKSKLLVKMTDSFNKNNKEESKEILKTINESKDFKNLYLLYEELEEKYFEDREIAKTYVDELSESLKNEVKKVKNVCENLNKKLKDIDGESNHVYTILDVLSENDNINNIDKKIIAKKELVSHLTKRKVKEIKENKIHTKNQNLLHAVLSNNFNLLFNNSLNESEKNELKDILTLSQKDTETKVTELKESLLNKVSTLLQESKSDHDLSSKLNNVREEIEMMTPTKYNFYRLKQLKNGLD